MLNATCSLVSILLLTDFFITEKTIAARIISAATANVFSFRIKMGLNASISRTFEMDIQNKVTLTWQAIPINDDFLSHNHNSAKLNRAFIH